MSDIHSAHYQDEHLSEDEQAHHYLNSGDHVASIDTVLQNLLNPRMTRSLTDN